MAAISGLLPDIDTQELGIIMVGSGAWQTFVWSCRMPIDRCESVGNVFASAGLTWSHAAEVVDDIAKQFVVFRERGNKDTDGLAHPGELLLGVIKCCYILMSSNPRVTDDDIMLDLPGVEEIIELAVRATNGAHDNGLCKLGVYMHQSHILFNWFLSCAAVSAKLGRHNESLAYAVAGLVPDFTKGGTSIPMTRILLMTLQANALAALGRKGKAGAVFEAAADEAHRAGMFLYEAFALRDLKVNVLDGMGHGEHGSRRVGAVLRRLTGPAELLTGLLGGLDAAELMALPEPEASYRVLYEQEDPAVVALRQELSGLRLKELRKRAQRTGLSEVELEDATDSDEPKATLMNMLVERCTVGSREGQELRSELEGLRLKELRARAKQANIDQDEMDDATDSDDPKTAMIELLLRHQADTVASASDDRPHFGSSPATAQPVQVSTKHVMLSYQWDHQAQVTRVYETLTKLGVKCWMDISGGMGQDIYESMAEGVSNASVVVCFMSQKYQDSEK